MKNYNIGLDIGTTSVGWAIVDDQTNEIIRKKKKSLWGVRLFEEAQTAEDRRKKRGVRRRYERRKERIRLLQEEFKEEINKVDKDFYQKLAETKYNLEKDKSNKTIQIKIAPTSITKFDEKYKTIYHLRYDLMNNKEQKDIRLVYLALHHIIKYRGNFNYGGKNFNTEGIDIASKLQEVFEYIRNYCDTLEINEDCIDEINYQEILSCLNEETKNDITKKLKEYFKSKEFPVNFANELSNALVGKKFNVGKFFNMELDEKLELNFESTDYEDKSDKIEKLPDYAIELLEEVKELYDEISLKEIFKNSEQITLSGLMIERYKIHQKDLALIKNTLKQNRDIYNKFFKTRKNDSKPCFYEQYINNHLTANDFCKELKKCLEKNNMVIDDVDFNKRFLNDEILPRITSTENGIFPYGLNRQELVKIIENQGVYYPFLLNKIGKEYKIAKLYDFRIPYYVGPLVSSDKSNNAWLIRKSDGKITPYNFDEVVDKENTAEKFILRMISHCSYLLDEYALPNCSLLYNRFKVLNELKQIRINNGSYAEKIPVEQQNIIIEKLFKQTNGSITDKKFREFLQNELGYDFYSDELKITGYSADGKFANNMQSYYDFFGEDGIFKGTDYTKDNAEEIIRWITIFEDKDILKRKVEEAYPELSIAQVKSILSKNYKGWGRLSKKLLVGLTIKEKETNLPKSIIDLMAETDKNFMQIINDDEYKFDRLIAKENKVTEKEELSYDVVSKLATSPANKRGIYQALKVVQELVQYMGYAPKNIMIEMARGNEKKVRKDDRKKYLQKLYEKIKNENKSVYDLYYKNLDSKLNKAEKIDTDKLYLYYLQEGKCLYCMKPIEIEKLGLNDSTYEIDHILPRTLVKDNSWDNRALVCRECNQNKGADLVLKKVIRDNCNTFWKRLNDNKLLSNKKLYRLTRREYSEEDIKGFINRQLVETRQITKHVGHILQSYYPETNVVYYKADISHSYRERYKLYKFRDLNDYHHAHDAYLSAVLGNYQEKYMHYNLNYGLVKEFNDKLKEDKDYQTLCSGIIVNSLDEKYQNDFAIISPNLCNSETGELIFDAKEFNELVENTLYRNDILVSRKSEIRTGEFYNQTLYKKGKGKISINKNMPADIYGGFSSVNPSYLVFVKYNDKTKLIGIPIHIALENEKNTNVKINFIREQLKLKETDSLEILKDKISFETLVLYKDQKCYIKGYSIAHKNCELSNACQLKISKAFMKKYKELLRKVYKENYDSITSEDIQYAISFINYLFNCKKNYPLFAKEISKIEDNLDIKNYSFEQLSMIIKQLLVIYHCNSANGNLKDFDLSDRIGRLASINITNPTFIFSSVTGLYQKVVDFSGDK